VFGTVVISTLFRYTSMLLDVASFQVSRTVFITPILRPAALSVIGPGVAVGVGVDVDVAVAVG
jgi:hypothetical protein